MAARSLPSVKVVGVASMISNQVSGAASRRGYAAAVEASRKNVMAQKPTEKEPAPWIPDPVTGYYRPENMSSEIDVAELREVLLKQSKNRND